MDHLAAIKDPDARRRAAQNYGKLDAARLKRIKQALGRNMVQIPLQAGRIIEYYPATGELLWGVHPAIDKIHKNACAIRKDGTLYVSLPDGGTMMAARLAHAAIHGAIPEGHEVYCVNNDPSDLRAMNLRSRDTKRNIDTRGLDTPMSNNARAKMLEDLARIKRERGLV